MRGRRRRTPRSILLVVAQRDALAKAARNVPGVDVVVAKDLCAEDLAPGGDAGRLTVWTKAAIEALGIEMDPYKIILMPWITEKSLEQRRVAAEEIGYFQINNRLEFIVRREASKADIKAAVEELA